MANLFLFTFVLIFCLILNYFFFKGYLWLYEFSKEYGYMKQELEFARIELDVLRKKNLKIIQHEYE